MNIHDIAKLELQTLVGSKSFMAHYANAKLALKDSGLVPFLRIFATPQLLDGGENKDKASAEAAFSSGYNKCLNDILYFNELHAQPESKDKDIKPTFGALERMLDRGDITKEEYEQRARK